MRREGRSNVVPPAAEPKPDADGPHDAVFSLSDALAAPANQVHRLNLAKDPPSEISSLECLVRTLQCFPHLREVSLQRRLEAVRGYLWWAHANATNLCPLAGGAEPERSAVERMGESPQALQVAQEHRARLVAAEKGRAKGLGFLAALTSPLDMLQALVQRVSHGHFEFEEPEDVSVGQLARMDNDIDVSLLQASSVVRHSVCRDPYYRLVLVSRFDNLQIIDGIPVTWEEREKAKEVAPLVLQPLQTSHRLQGDLVCRALGASPNNRGRSNAKAFRQRVSAALMRKHSAQPRIRTLSSLSHSPRQFEYHPERVDHMVYGTVEGGIVLINPCSGQVLATGTSSQRLDQFDDAGDSVLGLCWLHHNPSHFVCGNEQGVIELFDTSQVGGGAGNGELLPRAQFDVFSKLTSLHVNCTDTFFLTSGHSNDVCLYDLNHGCCVDTFRNLHAQHINVAKFAHRSPHLFATSSFDCAVKLWDLRQGVKAPVFTRPTTTGAVMVCFSPNDEYLLASAVDNEVRQFLCDGRPHLTLQMKKLSPHNFTRAYYMNNGDLIASGCCEESVVRVHCARTGRLVVDLDICNDSLMRGTRPYVQSLRGSPHHSCNFSALLSFVDAGPSLLHVDLLNSQC